MSTIAAIATPQAQGGISVVRISGENALSVAERVFKPVSQKRICDMNGYTAAYGNIFDKDERLDDGVILVFHAPQSYTGEDVCEISCHGGIYITRRVLQACLDSGAELAQAGEFTKRALLNGKLSLTQAEAVIDVINAQSRQFLDCSNAQREGALFRRIEEVSESLTEIMSQIAAWVDYPEEDTPEVESEILLSQLRECEKNLSSLLSSYDTGKLLREGIVTAIVGKPNVGKSTLMNLLVGSERSIVTDIAGTTRDVVEETVLLGDTVLRIADCAGIRETDDVVESIGVQIMLKRLETAQLVLAVFDNSSPLDKEDFELFSYLTDKNVICIINKSDLEQKLDLSQLESRFEIIVTISAKTEKNADLLSFAISDRMKLNTLDAQAGFLANERQRRCAISAQEAVVEAINGIEYGMTLDATGVMLETALDSLLELSGKKASDTVIAEVFKRFCVGK